MGFLKDVFGGGKSGSIGGIIGSVLGTSGGIGLLSAIPGFGAVAQTGAAIGSRIVQQREASKQFRRAQRRVQPLGPGRAGQASRAAFIPDQAFPGGAPVPGQRPFVGAASPFFPGQRFGVRRARTRPEVVPLQGRPGPRFPDVGGTFGPAVRTLSRIGKPFTERFRKAFPGGAPAPASKSATALSPFLRGRTQVFGGLLGGVFPVPGEMMLPGPLGPFGRGGLGPPAPPRRRLPMPRRAEDVRSLARMQFGFGVPEAVNPATGCVEPVESIRAQGFEPARPFFRFDQNRGQFVKIKARRINPLNPRALNRAHKRVKSFDRFVKQNFRVVERSVKFKPKKRRKRR